VVGTLGTTRWMSMSPDEALYMPPLNTLAINAPSIEDSPVTLSNDDVNTRD
jgi:hypothetical protein